MKKLLKPKFYLAPTLVAALALAACSDNGEGGSSEGTGGGDASSDNETIYNEDEIYSLDDFEPTKGNEGEDIGGGTLNVGQVNSSEFEGVFHPVFYHSAYDGEILDFFHEGIFHFDEAWNYVDTGVGSIEFADDYLSATVSIEEGVTWHDGEPFTIDDWTYSYEVIAHPDYAGPRYTSQVRIVEGTEEYKAGEADEISGFNIIDDYTVEVTFTEASPATLSGGLWTLPVPRHIYEDIPVDEQAEHEASRVNPIGIGAFAVDNIVPGESVTFTKNEDYWQGEPLLDGVNLQVYNPDVITQALQNGSVDIATSYPATQFADNAQLTNVDWLGRVDPGYGYIGFKLGEWDGEQNVPNPDAKMADINLREAMAKAVDWDTLGEEMYNGLRYRANTIIPPYHSVYHNEDIEGHTFDQDAANQILDDAGYELNGDYRQTPDGEELTITFAAMESDATGEAMNRWIMQSWNEIGLNVELLEGQLHEFNTFYDRVEEDDPEIDVYSAAWSIGANADPSSVWGPDSLSNYTRYTDEEGQQILERGVSVDAFDQEVREEAYNEWQEYFNEVIPAAQSQYRVGVRPINKRVNGHTFLGYENEYGYHTIYLSEEEGVVHE